MADRLMDAVIKANHRRVELRVLVSLSCNLDTSSRTETGYVADL